MKFEHKNLRGTPVLTELAKICRSYSVVFSLSYDLEKGRGSGTFVRYKNICGILTATHIVAKHIDAQFIYAPLWKTSDPTIFEMKAIKILNLVYLETPQGIKALKTGDWVEETLDICLIQIDQKNFDYLLRISHKQSVDLVAHQEKYLDNPEKYDHPYSHDEDNLYDYSFAVDGAPGTVSWILSQTVLELNYGGLYVCGGAKNRPTYKIDALKLVKTPFDREADQGRHELGPTADILPDRFRGISGAGMHQVSFGGTNGSPEFINDMFFSGICVAEDEGKCLFSRGPHALYEIFTPYLDTQFSQQHLL